MILSNDIFRLEKSLWTHEDFETMGWHDSMIYSMCIEKNEDKWTGDLIFDIDYIFKWVHPDKESQPFSFWVAPCTLIFEETFGLKINLNTADYTIDGLEISDLELIKKERQNSVDRFYWNIELQKGNIEFESSGFRQFVRQMPIHVPGQQLTLKDRGGISFDKRCVGL